MPTQSKAIRSFFSPWGFLGLLGLLLLSTPAQAVSPVKISTVPDKSSYLSTEPIKIQITVENISGSEVIAREGFLDQEFHLAMTFFDPDGLPVRNRFDDGGIEPGPPFRFQGQGAVPVEPIPIAETRLTVMDDAHFYYDLSKFGRYTAQVVVSLETFGQSTSDPNTGTLFGFLNDPARAGFDPVDTNTIAFEIVPATPVISSAVQVDVELLQTGGGKAGGKSPLEDVQVRLIRQADVPAALLPINFKDYEQIFNTVDPIASGLTNSTGQVQFEEIEQDAYVVIGLATPGQDFQQMGRTIDADDAAWGTGTPIAKKLTLKEKKPKKPKKPKKSGLTLDLHICRKNTRQAMKYRGFTAIERKSWK